MINALLDKIFFRLRIVYDNLLKFLKTLKKIKTYFIRVNNRYKVTRKIRKKEKIQKIDKVVHFHTSKQFVSFSSRSTYMFQFFVFFVVSLIIVSKKMLMKTFVLIVMNKVMLQQII